MTADELKKNFGTYAEAKAKGQAKRSLFGRGALDVLLYHEESSIYTVKDGAFSKCRVFWDQHPKCEIEELGPPTRALLDTYRLPTSLTNSGTVVRFRVKEGTPIPNDEIAKLSSFYMLRLIASDPNSEVHVERTRTTGQSSGSLSYDFPIGNVLGRFSTELDLPDLGSLPVEILVARSDQPLQSDPTRIDQRENGLLFVDENDAVMDLTLLPDYDRNPDYLKHIFGIVRISSIRTILETKLEAEEAEAVLTETRDGFNRKHPITQKLFALIEQYVKPLYEKEVSRQKRGDANRSERLNQRIREALKVLNQFNSEETDESGRNPKPLKPDQAISFTVNTIRLVAGEPKRIHGLVNLQAVKNGEIILFACDNSEIKITPDSVIIKPRGTQTHQKFDLTATCTVKGEKASVTAMTIGKTGEDLQATLHITGVDDPPIFQLPEVMEFRPSRFTGDPNRLNRAVLLVNLRAFAGMPEITFWLEEKEGKITLGDDNVERLQIKVTTEHVIEKHNVARVLIPFRGTGWGQHARLWAKAKLRDGEVAKAKCRVSLEQPEGNDKFSNFLYEPFDRDVLGEVYQDTIYVNARYDLHQQIFGQTQADFDNQLELNPIAQMRAAQVVVEAAVHHAAYEKWRNGGDKGLNIERDDPITSLRTYIEENRMKLEPPVIRVLAPDIGRRE